jgi:hypothetical protein
MWKGWKTEDFELQEKDISYLQEYRVYSRGNMRIEQYRALDGSEYWRGFASCPNVGGERFSGNTLEALLRGIEGRMKSWIRRVDKDIKKMRRGLGYVEKLTKEMEK